MDLKFFKNLKFSPGGLVAILLGTIFLAASMAPIPYRFMVAPKDQVYDGTEFWSDDYSAYVSYIMQGQRGKWLVYDTHTSEPGLPGILIHEEYLLWGKLTGLLGINSIYSYHLFRFVLGTILVYLCWKLITLVFPKKPSLQLTAFFLLLFVGGFPNYLPTGNPNLVFGPWSLNIESYIPWLTELDIFYRFVSLPHYLLGNIFFLLSLMQFIKIARSNFVFRVSDFGFFVFLGLAAGFTHAVSLVTLYATVAIYLLLTSIINLIVSPKKAYRQILIYGLFFSFYLALTSPILFYFKSLLTLSPWSNLSSAWEASSFYYVPLRELLLAIGPTIFIAPIGFIFLLTYKRSLGGESYETISLLDPFKKSVGEVVHEKMFSLDHAGLRDRILKHRSVEGRLSSENFLSKLPNSHFVAPLLLLSWLLSFFLLFYFSHPILHISQVRFFQTYLFIPAALLAAPVVIFLSELLAKLLFDSQRYLFRLLLLLSLLLLLATPTLPMAAKNFMGRFTFFRDFSYLAYPPKDWAEGIYWLRDNTSMDSVVLAAWQGGHHIPFMAGNYVYYGHLWGTLNIDQKRNLAEKFFKSQMNETEARQFLDNGRINYLYWGFEERSYGGDMKQYKNLFDRIYNSDAVEIFKVRR